MTDQTELKNLINDWQKMKAARLSADNLAKVAKQAEDRVAGAIAAQLRTMKEDTVIDTEHGGVYLAKVQKYVVGDWEKFYHFCPPQALEKRLLQAWAKEQKIIPPGVVVEYDHKLTIATS